MKEDILIELKKYLTDHVLVDFDDSNVNYDTNLFDAGFIDSFGVIELIEFIEKTYFVKLVNEDINDKRFSSVNGIVEIINEKQKGSN